MRATAIAVTLLLAAGASAQTQPQNLNTLFEATVAQNNPGDQTDVVVLYILDRNSISTPAGAQALVQTINSSRNDLQLTGSSSTPGNVALAEKTAIADIFAVAIERGAVTETMDGTNVTLATTPYAVATLFGANDTPRNWEALRPLRRVSVMTTFPSDAIVREGDFSNFLAGGLKFLILGNRSPRDAVIVSRAASALRKKGALPQRIARNLNCEAVMNSAWGRNTLAPAVTTYSNWYAANATASRDARVAKLAELVPNTAIDAETTALLATCGQSLEALESAEDAESTLVSTITQDYLAYNTKSQLSLTTLYQRDVANVSDYLTLKLLFGNDVLPNFRTNLNAQVDFNDSAKSAAGQKLDRVRGFSAEGSLTLGPFAQNRFTSDFAGKWYRQQNAKKSTFVTQGTINLKLTGNLNFPIGLSYATNAVDNVQKGFQFKLGFAVLLDQLLASNTSR